MQVPAVPKSICKVAAAAGICLGTFYETNFLSRQLPLNEHRRINKLTVQLK